MMQIIPKLLEYRQGDNVYAQMNDTGVMKYDPADLNGETENSSADVSNAVAIDWDAFKGTEIVAWFQMDDISYPIMQHSDNSYYLKHLPDGTYNGAGSLFLLNHNDPLFTDQSSFVYGHNMNNGSMFGSLKHYTTEASKDHFFYIYLPDGTRHTYQFFSVATVYQESKAYTWSFESDKTFLEWQEWMLNESMISTSLKPSETARYVTLSTCNGYSGTNHRLVVCGQEVSVDKLQEPASWFDDYMKQYEKKDSAKAIRAAEISSQLEAVQQTSLKALLQKRNGE